MNVDGGSGGSGRFLNFVSWSFFYNDYLAEPPYPPLPPFIHSIFSIGFIVGKERRKNQWNERRGSAAAPFCVQRQCGRGLGQDGAMGLSSACLPSSRNRCRSGTVTTAFAGRFRVDASHIKAPKMSSRSYATDWAAIPCRNGDVSLPSGCR